MWAQVTEYVGASDRKRVGASDRERVTVLPSKGPSTQIVGFQGPNTIQSVDFGSQNLTIWVLGPSGLHEVCNSSYFLARTGECVEHCPDGDYEVGDEDGFGLIMYRGSGFRA